MRTVLCTGSRGWEDDEGIFAALDSIARPFRIVVGDAKDGADPIFWMSAEILDAPRLCYRAHWNLHGKVAGPIRNKVMLDVLVRVRDAGEPAFGLAAWDGRSPGTKNMIGQLEAAKFDVWRIGG